MAKHVQFPRDEIFDLCLVEPAVAALIRLLFIGGALSLVDLPGYGLVA